MFLQKSIPTTFKSGVSQTIRIDTSMSSDVSVTYNGVEILPERTVDGYYIFTYTPTEPNGVLSVYASGQVSSLGDELNSGTWTRQQVTDLGAGVYQFLQDSSGQTKYMNSQVSEAISITLNGEAITLNGEEIKI